MSERTRCTCGRFARYDAYHGRWWCDRCDRRVRHPAEFAEAMRPVAKAMNLRGVLGAAAPAVEEQRFFRSERTDGKQQ